MYVWKWLCFSIDLKDACMYIPIAKHIHHFLCFVWQNKPSQWKFCYLGWSQVLEFLLLLIPPYCFFAVQRLLTIVYWDDILVVLARGQTLFCAIDWFFLGNARIFLSVTFILGLFWNIVDMSVSLLTDKSWDSATGTFFVADTVCKQSIRWC